jgi:trans-2,3-dihydro-3-hydroxyanthranilate isomerase
VPLSFLHYDVFTTEPLAGNQLAVFLDGRGLSTDRMQALAREMNFSESTFILPADTPGTEVRMRIFTPANEMPMAGHPTIGSTFALAHTGVIRSSVARFVFGLGAGPTPVDLEWEGAELRFAWMTQLTPTFGQPLALAARDAVAAALGLSAGDLAADLPVQKVSCGVPFLMVPLHNRDAVDRAISDAAAFRRLCAFTRLNLPVFMFALLPPGSEATVYSRMFAPEFGIVEDPATGIASGPLGCYLVQHRLVAPEAARRMVSLQGAAMGRPSRIHIAIEQRSGVIVDVKVGGTAVLVGRGEILV